MNVFYIVRHGQTDWNLLGKTQGHGDSSLTKEGISQTNSLADFLENENIDMIFSSDLGRAIQTADIIGNKLGLNINKTESLREMNFGLWEGLLIDEIKNNHKEIYDTWRNAPHLANIPGGETLDIIKDRVDRFINDINKKYDNKKILLVSHSITVRVMLLSFLNSPMENIYRIKQDNTALNIVEFRSYGPVVTKMNDTNHTKYKSLVNSIRL